MKRKRSLTPPGAGFSVAAAACPRGARWCEDFGHGTAQWRRTASSSKKS
jgi:hypothetical protein